MGLQPNTERLAHEPVVGAVVVPEGAVTPELHLPAK